MKKEENLVGGSYKSSWEREAERKLSIVVALIVEYSKCIIEKNVNMYNPVS
jgi:hypothetical protein